MQGYYSQGFFPESPILLYEWTFGAGHLYIFAFVFHLLKKKVHAQMTNHISLKTTQNNMKGGSSI